MSLMTVRSHYVCCDLVDSISRLHVPKSAADADICIAVACRCESLNVDL